MKRALLAILLCVAWALPSIATTVTHTFTGGTTAVATQVNDNFIDVTDALTTVENLFIAGDLAVANGGTGSSNAAGARGNLDVEPGVDVQAWDSDGDLDTIAGLTATSGNVMVAVTNAWASVALPVIDCTNCVSMLNADALADDPLWTGDHDFGGATALEIPNTVVGSLPAATLGRVAIVTDGADEDDCTVGGGIAQVHCMANGSTWEASGDSGTGTGIENVVEDVSPQLGADLDVNGFEIVSMSNGEITLRPHGTGDVVVVSTTWGVTTDGEFTGKSFIADPSATPSSIMTMITTGTQGGIQLSETGTDGVVDFVADEAGTLVPYAQADGVDENFEFFKPILVDEQGLEFQETDAITDCSGFSATGGGIWYDDSEGTFKKCEEGGSPEDLDTTAAGGIAGVTLTLCETLYAPNENIANTDDIPAVWSAPAALDITAVKCESDQTATTVDFSTDGGTTDLRTVAVTCDGTWVTGTWNSGEDQMAARDEMDLLVTAVSGTPERVTFCWEYDHD